MSRTIEQQAEMQRGAHDVWGERRQTDPVLRAVINVLCEHTEVSYYTVDWRPFLFGATCPMEQDGLARGLIQDPDDICGSQSIPYNEGGGGYLERFAAGLGAKAEQTARTVSQTVLDELREDYDLRRDRHGGRARARDPGGPRRAGPRRPARPLRRRMSPNGWQRRVLHAEGPKRHRGRADDRAVRAIQHDADGLA